MPQKAIKFFLQDVNYRIKGKTILRIWLEKVITLENKKLTDLNYIICSDSFLLELNNKFLKHNTLTDVISFNLSYTDEKIKGEIYISIERIRENAKRYNVKLLDELHRVMVHGLLHLLGYTDLKEEDKLIMRNKEDYYLSLR